MISTYSLVMKLMNSDTHSWTVSFASFAILALAGSVLFIILLMFAIGRYRSCSRIPLMYVAHYQLILLTQCEWTGLSPSLIESICRAGVTVPPMKSIK